MAHAQQQIVNALQAALVAGSALHAAKLFVDREDPLQAGDLPAIVIERDGGGGANAEVAFLDGTERRTLSLVVHCAASTADSLGANASALGAVVSKIIADNAPLRTLCSGGVLMPDDDLLLSQGGERAITEQRQVWQFIYFAHPSAPDVIL